MCKFPTVSALVGTSILITRRFIQSMKLTWGEKHTFLFKKLVRHITKKKRNIKLRPNLNRYRNKCLDLLHINVLLNQNRQTL